MNARIGKIARLPKPIREQLNQRLENGESGTSLVAWLNQLPEAQKIITEQFAGKPIRPQNLSEWRKGGYLDWLRHQLLREQTHWVAEQSTDLSADGGPYTISIAEDVAMVLSAELALHVRDLGAITNPSKRFKQFRLLCRELSRLRRDDQRALRIIQSRNQWRATHPQTDPAQIPNSLVESASLADATSQRQPDSPPEIPQKKEERETIPSVAPAPKPQDAEALHDALLTQGTPTLRASARDCSSPLPLSETETKPENPHLKPKTVNGSAATVYNAAEQTPSLPQPFAPPQPSAPIRPNPGSKYYTGPNRSGRRFICIEG
jgi:hypothetical protein